MPNTDDSSPDHERKPEWRHPFGTIAIVLWILAILGVIFDAKYAFARIRLLILANGLITIDAAFAALCTLLWYIRRHLVGPILDGRIAAEYGYRAGYRDCCQSGCGVPNLRLVDPDDDHHANDWRTAAALQLLAVNRTR